MLEQIAGRLEENMAAPIGLRRQRSDEFKGKIEDRRSKMRSEFDELRESFKK